PPAARPALIGRDPSSAYHLSSPLVSWRHAQLRRAPDGGLVLEDLGSTNGTYLNYARLRQPTRVTPGDRVQIGPYAFVSDGTALRTATSASGLRLDALDLVRTVNHGQTTLLDHVTLSVAPGEFVAIVGGNGAGKTTLMKALAGIQPAQQGRVFFN